MEPQLIETTKTTAHAEQRAVKPGFATTEGWLAAAASLIFVLYALGIVAPDGTSSIAKAIALAAAALTSLGYSVSRGMTKRSAS